MFFQVSATVIPLVSLRTKTSACAHVWMCTPGRFAIMNTWCGGVLNSAYKIPPFLLPVGPGWCLSNEVTSCHVTPTLTPPARPPFPPTNPPVWTFHLIPSTHRQPPTFPLLLLACVLWILRLLSVTNSPTQGYCLFSISAFVLPFRTDYSLISLVGGEDGERTGGRDSN